MILFTKNGCTACVKAGNMLDRAGIEYENKNIDEDIKNMDSLLVVSGNLNTPVIQDSDTLILGFSPKRIQELIDSKQKKQEQQDTKAN